MGRITSRPLEHKDLDMLQRALDQDQYEHADKEAYTQNGAYSEVYEDEQGPIGVLRYTKTLRLLTVWCDNKDRIRNGASVIQAITDAVTKAKESGFTDIIFNTQSPTLAKFCVDKLGFEESKGEYVKYV
jgi:hypothetical protein